MRYSMLFFPLVGVVVAAILYDVFVLFHHFALNTVLFVAVAVLVPILITGGIH